MRAALHGGMHKSMLPISLMMLLVAAIALKLRTLYNNIVPVGYQDENGFHPGEKPSDKNWPPFW